MYCLICTHKIDECICLSSPEADAKIAQQIAEIARLQAEVERLEHKLGNALALKKST